MIYLKMSKKDKIKRIAENNREYITPLELYSNKKAMKLLEDMFGIDMLKRWFLKKMQEYRGGVITIYPAPSGLKENRFLAMGWPEIFQIPIRNK